MNAVIIGNGLDTNGQNYRYVQAARKHGAEAMKSLAIGPADNAGVVARFQIAADKGDVLSIRSAAKVVPYFKFPSDIIWVQGDPHSEGLLRSLIAEADVIHLNNNYVAAMARLGVVRKPMLLHHHGSLLRDYTGKQLGIARQHRMAQAVSTVDLIRLAPDRLHWLPSAYDIDELQAFRDEHRREPDGSVRIGHFPTSLRPEAGKGTSHFLAAVRELQAEGLPIDLVTNPVAQGEKEGWDWQTTMVAKAQVDILFDQLGYGYGCNSIEAWGMGIPVISGGDAWTLNRMDEMWGALPFAEAEEPTLKDVIRGLVTSADMRQEYAERGLAHVRKHHDERPALDRLLELYELAIKTYHRQRTVAPVRFRNNGKSVTWDKVVIPSGTEIEISDPDAITHLRALAKRSAFDVEEVA